MLLFWDITETFLYKLIYRGVRTDKTSDIHIYHCNYITALHGLIKAYTLI